MATVLVVDDSPIDRKFVGNMLAKAPHLQLVFAADGEDALQKLADPGGINLIVTDMVMPNMNGLELVAAVVAKYPLVPLILMTGRGSEQIAADALRAGAASYVPKSELGDRLADTVDNVLSVAIEHQMQLRLLDAMTGCQFAIDNDVVLVSAMVQYLKRLVSRTQLCNETEQIRVCVALEEALNNALFHGNLEIDATLRETDRVAYRALIEERRASAPYCQRRIHLGVDIRADVGTFVIRDEGPGFDPASLPDPTDLANLDKPSGRGLLLMRTFMDQVVFNDSGNQVTLVKRRSPPNGTS